MTINQKQDKPCLSQSQFYGNILVLALSDKNPPT
jgi:hypothetical protein